MLAMVVAADSGGAPARNGLTSADRLVGDCR